MREELLHFIWKTNKLQQKALKTVDKASIQILHPGIHNMASGPDFFNAKIEINGQLWAGNVEIHLKSSDWYAHHHETDPKYDNVILHVVWEDDISVFRKDRSQIPTLELQPHVPHSLLSGYRSLLENSKRKFINCEKNIDDIPVFIWDSWLERLYIERLEQKSLAIFSLLKASQNDWEQVLFTLLLKNFGTKINGPSFLSVSKALGFSAVRKLRQDILPFESVLMGLCGLLASNDIQDGYYLSLQKEFEYQRNKFGFHLHKVQPPEFFGLRPNNFPTIRLSQLANLYHREENLFSKVIAATSSEEFYRLFAVEASLYWQEHYSFGKPSKKSKKKLTKAFIDLLIINTVVPLKFAYAKKRKANVDVTLINLLSSLKAEKNVITRNFADLGVSAKNALRSQAVLQLHTSYCSKNQCLKCAVGASLLSRIG